MHLLLERYLNTMKEKKVNNRLTDLTKKYSSYNVISEIENNLSKLSPSKINTSEIIIDQLLDLSLYNLDLYKSLEESILSEGVLTPIILFNDLNKKYLINGIKRYLIAKKNNISSLPCLDIFIDRNKINQYIINELSKNNDNILIRTHCYKKLIEIYNYSQEQISNMSNISLSNIKNILRLDLLPEYIKKDIIDNKVSYGKARALLNLDKDNQDKLYELVINPKYSVRDIEKYKRKYIGNSSRVTISQKHESIKITFLSEEEASKNIEKIKKLFSID